jgi:hypothetical protein
MEDHFPVFLARIFELHFNIFLFFFFFGNDCCQHPATPPGLSWWVDGGRTRERLVLFPRLQSFGGCIVPLKRRLRCISSTCALVFLGVRYLSRKKKRPSLSSPLS